MRRISLTRWTKSMRSSRLRHMQSRLRLPWRLKKGLLHMPLEVEAALFGKKKKISRPTTRPWPAESLHSLSEQKKPFDAPKHSSPSAFAFPFSSSTRHYALPRARRTAKGGAPRKPSPRLLKQSAKHMSQQRLMVPQNEQKIASFARPFVQPTALAPLPMKAFASQPLKTFTKGSPSPLRWAPTAKGLATPKGRPIAEPKPFGFPLTEANGSAHVAHKWQPIQWATPAMEEGRDAADTKEANWTPEQLYEGFFQRLIQILHEVAPTAPATEL